MSRSRSFRMVGNPEVVQRSHGGLPEEVLQKRRFK
jgi:hypothetical protein